MTSHRILWLACLGGLIGAAHTSAAPLLSQYDSPHYVIHTDLDADTVREVSIRLTSRFQEYTQRTSAFNIRINEKLPFYMFTEHADYLAAGGLPGSAGVFTGDKLMATMGLATGPFSWRLLQHEGFHQFVDRVIGRNIPVWVNEGLAEYFSVAIFTGDGFITGLVPPSLLARIKVKIRSRRFPPLADMMKVGREEWNHRLSGQDYDQAWSMVHFLAHGDGGKYERPFNGFLHDAGRTGVWDKAWVTHFGPGTDEFEAAWSKYWLNLPNDPTADLHAKAIVTTLTGFLARAVSQEQEFASAKEFLEQATAGKLLAHNGDWLPPALLDTSLAEARRSGEWSLSKGRRKNLELVYVAKNGSRFVGTFTLRKGRVKAVSVEASKK
jgi:hypothetical protein